MKSLPSSSAVFLCYNDGGTIASMVLSAKAALERLTEDYEIIVVNDASTDYSPLVLEQLTLLLPCLRVITHAANQGYGGALQAGLAAVTKEFVFYTDGDAQYDPRELVSLTAAMTDDVDVVNGYKVARRDPFHRRVVGSVYRLAMQRFFGLKVRDVDCDFRLIRRSVLSKVKLNVTSGAVCIEMVKKFQYAGARFAEVPVHHYFRPYGRSQFFQPGRIVRTLRDLMRLWWQLVVRRQGRDEMALPASEDLKAVVDGD